MTMEEQDSTLDDSYIHSVELGQECWNPSDWIHPNFLNSFPSQSLSPNAASMGHSDEDYEPPDESDPTDLSGETIDNEYIRGLCAQWICLLYKQDMSLMHGIATRKRWSCSIYF